MCFFFFISSSFNYYVLLFIFLQVDEQDKSRSSILCITSCFFGAFAMSAVVPLLPIMHQLFRESFSQLAFFFAAGFLGNILGVPIQVVSAGSAPVWNIVAAANAAVAFSGFLFSVGIYPPTSPDIEIADSTSLPFGSFFALCIARLFNGGAIVVLICSSISVVDAVYPPSARSGRKSVMILFATAFGLITGPLLGGTLASPSSLSGIFIIQMVVSGALAAFSFMQGRTVPITIQKIEPIQSLFRDPHTLLSCGILAVGGYVAAVAEAALPMRAMIAFESSPAAVGGLVMILSVSAVFTVNVIALGASNFPVSVATFVAPCAPAVMLCLLLIPTDLAAEVVPVLLLGACLAMVSIVGLLRLLYTVGEAGSAQSAQPIILVSFLAVGVGKVCGSLMYPMIASMSNADDAVSSCGVIGIMLGAVCFLFLMQERRRSMLSESAGVADESSELQVLVPVVSDLALVFSM
jgi:MFS family permease